VSGALAEALGGVWANQFDNVANRAAHVATTGPEIWEQTHGKLHGFSCAVGTGGTLAGTATYLREASRWKGRPVQIGLTDPRGAALYRYYRDGELRSEGESITEGIGQGRITANLEGFVPDHAFEIGDAAALECAYGLLRDEGLAVGLSSGVNVAGAMEMARALGPRSTVVTILCDLAHRYSSKMFAPEYLRERGLPTPEWLEPPHAPDDVDDAMAAVRAAAAAAGEGQ
jgi:cysteine synthase A